MQCYYHPERPALGVCRHCGRGLCTECAALVDDVLACRDRHESQVRGLNLASERLVLQARRLGSGYLRNAVFYGLVGLLFAGFGLMQVRYLGLQAVFFILIGVFLLYAALANLLEARKYR
jgi:sulfite exporter TauE/SafE